MKYSIRDYLPIIYIYLFSILIPLNLVFYNSWGWLYPIIWFLGLFSLIFAVLKIINFKGFVESFVEYDFISKKFLPYAYAFPFFELFFALSLLTTRNYPWIMWTCLVFYAINLASVTNALLKKKMFMCACLGGVFKVPLSYVSLLESLTMIAGMAYLLFR